MTELQVLRWFENIECPEEEDIQRCKWCKELDDECTCIDDWKLRD